MHHEGHNYYLHHHHKSGILFSWHCAKQPCKGKCKTGSKTDENTFFNLTCHHTCMLQPDCKRWADNFGEEIKYKIKFCKRRGKRLNKKLKMECATQTSFTCIPATEVCVGNFTHCYVRRFCRETGVDVHNNNSLSNERNNNV